MLEYGEKIGCEFGFGASHIGVENHECPAVLLFGLPSIIIQHPGAVDQALAWYELGMDFADTLHLASLPRLTAG